MNWTHLENISQLEEVKEQENALIFKHSIRCSISATALSRLTRQWKSAELPQLKLYFLDLVNHRDISNAIAQTFGVEHQSPQILLLKKGHCIYDESHYGIDYENIKSAIEKSL